MEEGVGGGVRRRRVRGESTDGPGISPKRLVQPTCSKRVGKKNWVGNGWPRGELGVGRAHSFPSISSINNGCNLPTGFCSSQHLLDTSPCQAQCPVGRYTPPCGPPRALHWGLTLEPALVSVLQPLRYEMSTTLSISQIEAGGEVGRVGPWSPRRTCRLSKGL